MYSAEEMGIDQLTIMPDGRGFVNVHGSSTKLSTFLAHLIPMQSTSLCDKNGKDLDWWEGDIVKTYGETYKENWLIIKDQGCFWLERISDKFRVPCYETIKWGGKKEVIGDIHSTPELMEKAE